jgi:hypothetical protein
MEKFTEIYGNSRAHRARAMQNKTNYYFYTIIQYIAAGCNESSSGASITAVLGK